VNGYARLCFAVLLVAWWLYLVAPLVQRVDAIILGGHIGVSGFK